MTALPLDDLIVIDLTVARAGPTAVRQLADWGADVIRIESPQAAMGENHHTPDYLNLHRNKRSIIVDLKAAAGRDLLYRLLETADVLVENMRAPVKHRLGFDWSTVSAINPGLVMGSISGFGQSGPYAERGGVDQIAQGLGGMMSVTGLPDQGPVRAGAAVSDIAAGLQLAVGIMVALHERHRTGAGRWVHTSLLESMVGMLDFQAARWTVAGEVPPPAGNDHPTLGPMGMYRTSDGNINIAAPWGRLWREFCVLLGHPEWLEDARFITPQSRSAHSNDLARLVEAALAGDTTASWVRALNDVGVPAGAVNDLEQTFADPQVQHLGIATPVDHPTLGPHQIIRNATHLEGVPDHVRRHSPEGGEHTDEVLGQFGLSPGEIGALREGGVIE